jgi:alkanesulfonate monooxygenase SsuD/methylene tetrahydromethanopterin reductase-like flavin-dependent oxidoreductase (luciferase family)
MHINTHLVFMCMSAAAPDTRDAVGAMTAATPEFGLFLIPDAASYRELVRQVDAAERGGLDLIGIQDHPYQRRFLDTFLLIADLMARTERLRFFPDVANLPLRPPALLAKAAASLDVMSGGRFELGLGAGAYWEAIEAMGGPVRSPREAVDALDEAIAIIRRAWSGERSITAEGEYYTVRGYHPGPPPAHPIGIWLGAYKPRMLALTGRTADGWVPSLGSRTAAELAEMRRRVDDASTAVGRDPGAIRRVLNVGGMIEDGPVRERLHGPPEHWVETLSGFAVDLGFDAFVLWPAADVLGQVERFATEVAPAVRQVLGRGQPARVRVRQALTTMAAPAPARCARGPAAAASGRGIVRGRRSGRSASRSSCPHPRG